MANDKSGYAAGAGWAGVASGAYGLGSFIGSPGAGVISGTGGKTTTGPLAPDALAWVLSLDEETGGKWLVPGRGEQTPAEWLSFLSTPQGRAWWASRTDAQKDTLMPYYTVGGQASARGAAQGWSTQEHPVLALPWLRGKPSELPSVKNPYGIPSGGGGFLGATLRGELETGATKTQGRGFLNIYRPWEEREPIRRRVAPPARWLLY